jgi:hypothetical protein
VQLMSTVIPSLEALKKKASKASVRLINIHVRAHYSLHSCKQLGCVLV